MNEINNELGVYGYDEEVELFKSNFEQTGYTSIGSWENDNNIYGIGINDFGNTGFGIISIWKFHNSEDSEDFENYTGETKYSTSYELQKIVASWYNALRAIALVGLLSVLVYVGIRILISSTSQEKAKYKKMVGDWLAAICLLFILQYIMVFVLEITQKITDVLSANAIGPNGEDVLLTSLRNQMGYSSQFKVIFTELILYLVLVIYTILFTIQYLKRLVYMAFFTMIAPLIALTYPLDKIKDGQAQAFSMWLREYIFNALLQPMHLLIYVMFVSSAIDLSKSNPLYAIVVIGFMLPAEKFFRKMFGFDKAQSSNQFGAAAGGALIMNAINKMGHRSGKKAAGGAGGSAGGEAGGGSTPRYVSSPGSQSGGGENTSDQNQGGPNNSGATRVFNQDVAGAGTRQSSSVLSGARTLGGHYFNKANGAKIAKGLGRTARKIGVGGVGAAALGTVGLAAGIATGDAGNAVKYGLAGAGAGYIGANNLGDKATAFEKKNREIYKEGALGTDEYNASKNIRDLKNDGDFNASYKNLKNAPDKEQLIRKFQSNGIKSTSDIKKMVNIMAKTGYSQDEIIAAQKIKKRADQDGLKRDNIEKRLKRQDVQGDNLKKCMTIIDML